MAVNLFYEARDQSSKGQRWLLDVVTNRVAHPRYPDSICGVVTQRKQFSWYWYIGKELPKDPLHWEGYVEERYSHDKIEMAALHRAFATAQDHFENGPEDRTGGSIYYMTPLGLKNQMRHIKSYDLAGSVQDHMFFTKIVWR